MLESEQEATIGRQDSFASRFYLAREPFLLTVLSVMALAFFLLVTFLSHAYHKQQQLLGGRWFSRGVAELQAKSFQPAVNDLRAALLYAPDNYVYQLKLSQALLGQGQSAEARAYLLNLWEREPENGVVNLELARIAVQNSRHEEALRYYHNAIYSTWPESQPQDREQERRKARLELIDYLLRSHANAQAQSELIALAANLANVDDAMQHLQIAELFSKAEDYEHALAEFRRVLLLKPSEPAAWAGAGTAAFELHRYSDAQRYLTAAVSNNPGDLQSATLLKRTELVLQLDPFSRRALSRRNRIVLEDFAAAGDRLQSCTAENPKAIASVQGSGLASRWQQLKPQISQAGLRRDPELIEAVMDLVFDIERQTNIACGSPTERDLALLLIAKLHEGK